jgi:hypothetical protein
MEASLSKGLNHGEISFASRCTKGWKWPGRAGHGRKTVASLKWGLRGVVEPGPE